MLPLLLSSRCREPVVPCSALFPPAAVAAVVAGKRLVLPLPAPPASMGSSLTPAALSRLRTDSAMLW